ncbi:MAG: ABC transporter permease [Alphaproteobacteria bacterium]|nr:MAG: ABC transporter permease [Alphaproteobacteria bacterium]
MVTKEFIQLRRDRLTFATMIAIPIMQLILFGYAINTDPKHLPTAVFARDQGPLTRAVLASIRNTGYFDLNATVGSAAEMERLMRAGKIQFGIEIPADFERDVRRGERPAILVLADASDPTATGGAVAALQAIPGRALVRELRGPNADIALVPEPFRLIVHQRYNPERSTHLNIVPGLLGVILTMTMMIYTALAVTREIERGTMENLLAMPIRPFEIMLGKILPFVLVGFIQMSLILAAAKFLFDVPILGSLPLLVVLTTLFAGVNLSVGYTISTFASNQLQAVQMAFFFFLPNVLLSGFMFPFRGMPGWAQWVGEILPLTHYLRIVRGIMLKGNGLADMMGDVALLIIFTILIMGLALLRFRTTLD